MKIVGLVMQNCKFDSEAISDKIVISIVILKIVTALLCTHPWGEVQMTITYSEDNIHNNHAVSEARTTTSLAFHLNCHVGDHCDVFARWYD